MAKEDKPQEKITKLDYNVDLYPIAEIFADEDFNCRGHIVASDVLDLANDIKKSGLQVPITIQPWEFNPPYKFRCVTGYCRLLAFRINKMDKIPAFVKVGLSDLEARKMNLKENLIRKNLNVMQEAKAIAPYVNASWTEADIASEFEQSRGWVQIRKAAVSLPKEIQLEIAAGFVSQENILRLSRMKNPIDQFEFIKKLKDHKDKGEKLKIEKPERKIANFDRKPRRPAEIFPHIEYLLDLTGPSLTTRALAWAAGTISDIEFAQDVRDWCDKEGVIYTPHASVKDILN